MFSFFKSLQWEKIYIYIITALYFHISLSLSPLRFQGTPIQKQPSRFITPVAKVAANFLHLFLEESLITQYPQILKGENKPIFSPWNFKSTLWTSGSLMSVGTKRFDYHPSTPHHITSQMVDGTWCFWGNWSLGKSLKLVNPPSNIISYRLCLFMVLEAIHPIVSRPGDGSIL